MLPLTVVPDYEYRPRKRKDTRQAFEGKYDQTSGQQQDSNIHCIGSQSMPSGQPRFLDPVLFAPSPVPQPVSSNIYLPFNTHNQATMYRMGQSQSLRLGVKFLIAIFYTSCYQCI